MSKFQIVLLCVFGFFILVAVVVFAFYRGGSSSQATVTVWGSIPSEDFNLLYSTGGLPQDNNLTINYVEKKATTLESEFTEALASGRGPDLIILPQDELWRNKSKLIAVPYTSVSAKDFTDTYVEAAELYLLPEGIYGFPITIDPLVLYYNRDMLSSAAISKPVGYWDEVYNSTLTLSKRDAAGNLVKSAVALGETKNIAHAKDILALLMLQAGTPITAFQGSDLRSVLSYNFDLPVAPAVSALDFYTQFSNPTKQYYSWNRALPEAQTRFTSGDLAYYIGYASELRTLKSKNPTLNFGVVSVPQSRVSGKIVTAARLQAISISRGTTNPGAALTAALRLVASGSSQIIANSLALPPARRDLLSKRPTDSIYPIFYNAALQAKSWVDPNASGTEKVFDDMIDAVTSGRARTVEAVTSANTQLEALTN